MAKSNGTSPPHGCGCDLGASAAVVVFGRFTARGITEHAACGRQRARSTNEPDFGGRAQRTEVDANDAVLVEADGFKHPSFELAQFTMNTEYWRR